MNQFSDSEFLYPTNMEIKLVLLLLYFNPIT